MPTTDTQDEVEARLCEFQHLLYDRLYWVYNACAPIKNSVGMQSVANELHFKIDEIAALARHQQEEIRRLRVNAERYAWLRRHLLIVDPNGKEPTAADYAQFDAAIGKEREHG